MVNYDSRFLQLTTGTQVIASPSWTSTSFNTHTFEAKDSGSSLTQYHQNGAVRVPITVSTEYGFSSTVYVTVQY